MMIDCIKILLQINEYSTTNFLLSSEFLMASVRLLLIWDEWPSGLYSLRQVTEVKLGRVRSNSGWVTSEA